MCTTMNLDLQFRWILHSTSFIRVTTLYGPSHEDWNLRDFPFVQVER
jgi:hypothetical protein